MRGRELLAVALFSLLAAVCGVPTICNDVERVVTLLRPGSKQTAAETIEAAQERGVSVPTAGAGADRWLPIEAIRKHVEAQPPGFVNPRRAMFACTEGIEKDVDDNSITSMYDTGDVLTVLGGDLAEYLLAVNVYRHHFNGTRGDTLESALSLFTDYLLSTPASRTFYFHSTPSATRAMYEKYGLDIDEDLRDPFGLEVPQEFNKPKILAGVVDPQFVGCEHLKQILLHPTAYHTPRGLTERVIQAAFLYLWSGNRLTDETKRDIQFELVNADYRGSAVLWVTNNVTEGKCSVDKHFYPFIAPRMNWVPHDLTGDVTQVDADGEPVVVRHAKTVPYQLYIQYPQSAVHRRRHNMAQFFVQQPMNLPKAKHIPHHTTGVTAVPLNIFHQHMDKLAREQHALTLDVLTAGLPVYQLTLIPRPGVDADLSADSPGAGSTGWLRYASIGVLVMLGACGIVFYGFYRRSQSGTAEEGLPLVSAVSASNQS